MPQKTLDNYLRSFRRRAGLTQDELAFLLGRKSGTHVSRYEQGRRAPSLETLLALEAAFGVPVRSLYRGKFETVDSTVRERAGILLSRLGNDTSKRKRLRALLTEIYSRESPEDLW
jgi:transcriptional regulator with XRE-family HTH domain